MNYAKEIIEKLNILDEVLDGIKISHLLENTDFFIDEMSMESWVKINLKHDNENKIPLSFILTLTELEIRLDRIAEAVSWSNGDLKNSKDLIKGVLKNILTSYVLVKYHGSSRTQISLFGSNGQRTNNFKYREGFSLIGTQEEKLYFPIYSVW